MNKTAKHSGRMRLLLLVVSVLTALLLMAGCTSVDIDTTITVDTEFSGERVMALEFSKTDVLAQYGTLELLDIAVEQAKPSEMSFERAPAVSGSDLVVYEFKMEFSSMDDYKSQLKSILGREAQIEYTLVDKVFSKGLTYSEDFESRDLFAWVDKAIEAADFFGYEGTYDSGEVWRHSGVTLTIDGKTYECDGGKAVVNEGSSNLLKSAGITTLINRDGTFTRTFDFRLVDDIDQASFSQVSEHLEASKPEDAVIKQDTTTGAYSVSFEAADVTALSGGTAKLLGSNSYTASFGAIEDLDTPFSQLEALEETIDFSQLCNDVKMEFSYKVESERGTPTRLFRYDNDAATELQPVISGSSMLGTISGSTVKLRTILESISNAQIIYYNLIMNDKDSFTREVLICMEDGTSEEVLGQIKAYFDQKGAPSTNIEVLSQSDIATPHVRIVIEGTGEQVARAETVLFSGASSRTLAYNRESGLFKVTPATTLRDEYDISALLSMTNVSTYIYSATTLDEVTKITFITDGQTSISEPEQPQKVIGKEMTEGASAVEFTGSYFNTSAVVFIILLVVLIILLAILAIVLIMRMTKKEEEEKEEPKPAAKTEEPVALPEPRDLTRAIESEEEELPALDVGYYPPSRVESEPEPEESDYCGVFTHLDGVEPEQETEPEPEPIVLAAPEVEPEPEEKPAIKVKISPLVREEPESEAVQEPEPQVEEEEDTWEFPPAPVDPEAEKYAFLYEQPEPRTESQPEPGAYSDADMIADLEQLGYLDEYAERVSRVKIKVKRKK